MNPLRWLPLLPILLVSPASAGTPAEAALIQKEYTLQNERWELEVKAATTLAAKRAAFATRPSAPTYALKMWACLSPSLAEDWTLDPAAWLLRLSPVLATTTTDPAVKASLTGIPVKIREAIEKNHLRSPKLASMCLAQAFVQDPESMELLQKVEAQNPDAKIQGVAALGEAILLKGLDDGPEVMKRRISLIRKAVLNSADMEIEGTSIANLAGDELYIIQNLSRDRIAPDLAGTDSGGKAFKISDYKGKIVVLLFWGTGSTPDLDQFIEITASLTKKFADKPFALIGVNDDTIETLRELQKSGKIAWPNFSDFDGKLAREYRVGSKPLAYVLDKDHTIRYVGAPGSFIEISVEGLLADKPAEGK